MVMVERRMTKDGDKKVQCDHQVGKAGRLMMAEKARRGKHTPSASCPVEMEQRRLERSDYYLQLYSWI